MCQHMQRRHAFVIRVAFGADETIYHSQATIIDNGLLLRSVKTTGDYQAELAKKQHEQQLQQANQALFQ